MVDQLTLQTIGILMTGISLTIASAYYTFTLRNTQKNQQLQLETRQIQFCWQALERVHDKEFMRRMLKIMYHQNFKDYEEWREKYGPNTDPDAYVDYYQVTSTFQGLGYLVQNKVLELEALSKHIRPRSIIFLWDKIEPIVRVHRETLNPTAYDSFEYLANELRTLLERRVAQARIYTE